MENWEIKGVMSRKRYSLVISSYKVVEYSLVTNSKSVHILLGTPINNKQVHIK